MNKLFKLSFLVIPLVPAIIFAAHEGRPTATDKFKAKKDLLRLQNLIEDRCDMSHTIRTWKQSDIKKKEYLIKISLNLQEKQIKEIGRLTVQYDRSDSRLQKAVDATITATSNNHFNYRLRRTEAENQPFEANKVKANAELEKVFFQCLKAKQSLIKQKKSNVLLATRCHRLPNCNRA